MNEEIYNKAYYDNYDTAEGKVNYRDAASIKAFLTSVADHIVSELHPKTVLDTGCATGHLVAALRDRGVEAYGIDISEYAISQVREDIRPFCAVGSLTEPVPDFFPEHFDLITNIEVIEHLYADEGEKAIRNLSTLTDQVLFSSSPDDFEEPTHLNVQQREYWARVFAKYGFYDNLLYRPLYLSEYAVLYKKLDDPLRAIEGYERFVRQNEASQKSRQNELETVREQLSQASKRITEAAAENEGLRGKMVDAEQAVQERQIRITELQSALTEQEEETHRQQELAGEKEKELEACEKELSDQLDQMQGIKTELSANKQALQLAEEDLQVNKTALQRTEEELSANKQALQLAEEDLQVSKTALQRTEEELSANKQALQLAEEDLQVNKTALQRTEEELSANKETLQLTRKELSDSKKALQIAGKELNELKEQSSHTEAELAHYKLHYHAAINQREELKNRVSCLEQEAARAKHDYSEISKAEFWRITRPARFTLDFLKWLFYPHSRKHLLRKGLHSLRTEGVRSTWLKVLDTIYSDLPVSSGELFTEQEQIEQRELFTEQELTEQREHQFPRRIKFSIIVPLYNTPKKMLCAMMDSVMAQTYSNWELCMADGSDAGHRDVKHLSRKYAKRDSRIRYQKLKSNLGISGNTNACLEMATGDYICLLDHDDLLHPAALYEVMRAICEKGADFIYTDEATFHETPADAYVQHFKPDFAPDNLRANNYICHFSVFKRALLDDVGLFDPDIDGSQDHDMVLRLTERAERIAHIPEILYYWRAHAGSAAESAGAKPYAIKAGVRAVEKQLARLRLEGTVESVRPGLTIYRTRYKINGIPRVSILIANYEHLDDLRNCLDSIINKTTWSNYEIVIVENNSSSPELFAYYEKIQKERDNIRVVTWPGSFNYSAINNYGAQHCTGDYLLFLNNDTEIITPGWIEEMLMFAQRSDVGAVGAMLYYPDNTIQHAGVCLGLGGVAGHYYRKTARDQVGYMGRLLYAQNMSAVTAACMMIRLDVWEKMAGFDEEFAVAFNDIDLCMRIRQAGYLIVWTPFAELYHYESKSRGMDDTPEKQIRFQSEVDRFQQRWKDALAAGDPYFNPNFSIDRGDFAVAKELDRHDAR